MIRILTTILMLTASLTIQAQQGLAINQLFEGRIIPPTDMVETRVRGREIAKYQLSFFHSLRFEATENEVVHIRQLIESEQHTDQYLRSDKQSKTLTIMVQLKPQGTTNRFTCMKVGRTNKTIQDVTVIYMEGKLHSLERLEELLHNQK